LESGPTSFGASPNVVQLKNGKYGVEFEFDDGYTDFAEVGSKATADFDAAVHSGILS